MCWYVYMSADAHGGQRHQKLELAGGCEHPALGAVNSTYVLLTDSGAISLASSFSFFRLKKYIEKY